MTSLVTTAGRVRQRADVAGGTVGEAKLLILGAMQSGGGLVRLTTQAGSAAEVAALVLLAGSTDLLGGHAAAVVSRANDRPYRDPSHNLYVHVPFDDITSTSTWGELVTVIAAS